MKIKNKIFYIIAFIAMFWTSITYAWNCPSQYRALILFFDSSPWNGELKWTGSTQYSDAWDYAIDTWDDEGAIDISYVDSYWSSDLKVYDVNKSNVDWVGHWYFRTYIPDKIALNKHYLKSANNDTKEKNAALHELGHAFGLHHSYYPNIMYYKSSSKIDLGWQDKQCYNYNWD